MMMARVKHMAMIIRPMVKGSFRNLVLMKAKTAERIVRIEIMVNTSIARALELIEVLKIEIVCGKGKSRVGSLKSEAGSRK